MKAKVIPKACTKCKVSKNPGEFSRDSKRKDGRCPQCKTCRRAYRTANADALKAQRQIYKDKPMSRFNTYKASAKYRGYDWELSYAEFMVHWKKSCVHCDSAIETIGLDRIDPEKPYESTNVEPCCFNCNRMKSDLTTEDFLSHIRKIINHTDFPMKSKDNS
jgi:hypothetical protein